jgi:DNA (cytosine-5)-methyltransferase 1
MRELALFAGAGGGILGGKLLGWRTVCAVEIDAFCREVLLRRQLDECLPRFPIWDDVRTFDGKFWKGKVDIVTGGFPCQDISPVGTRKGITGFRSSLWFAMSKIVGDVRPRVAFVENSPHLRTKGLGEVVEELAEMGYESRWGVLGARHVGAPHKQRNRIWIVATDPYRGRIWIKSGRRCGKGWTEEAEFKLSTTDFTSKQVGTARQSRGQLSLDFANVKSNGLSPCQRTPNRSHTETRRSTPWWAAEPNVGRVVYGLPFRVDRIRALGNAQIPAVARLAWEILGFGH